MFGYLCFLLTLIIVRRQKGSLVAKETIRIRQRRIIVRRQKGSLVASLMG